MSGKKAAKPATWKTVDGQVTFRLSPTVREKAERLAADRGTTLSALAREALEQLVCKAPGQRRVMQVKKNVIGDPEPRAPSLATGTTRPSLAAGVAWPSGLEPACGRPIDPPR